VTSLGKLFWGATTVTLVVCSGHGFCQRKESKLEIETKANTRWSELPSLPEAIAGQCVGVAGDRIIVAGGSLWTAPPWNQGVKKWSDRIYGLARGSNRWELLGHLPSPMGYSASVQMGDSLLCIGGQSATEPLSTTLKISYRAGAIEIQKLEPLPRPLTNASAGSAGDGKVYVVGGQHSLKPEDVSRQVYRIDFNGKGKWEELSSVPWSHARILPAVSGCDDRIYIAGGADLRIAKDGTPQREYLRDAWSFSSKLETWQRLPDLPAAVTAAPSACTADGTWLIFGGDDGTLAQQIQTLKDDHPGFRRTVLQLSRDSSRWIEVTDMPISLVTTGVAHWGDNYVIAGGENQPGHRSSRVIALPFR
jgi:N-acetylneuraminic acid mutarotase